MPHTHEHNPRRSTPLSDLDPDLTDLSRRVIGCAIEVHKDLGPGYPLEIYRAALLHELKEEEIPAEEHKPYEVEYDERTIGSVHADLSIRDRFLLNICAEDREVTGGQRSALRAVLRAADLELGLIINFGQRRLKDGLVRVLNPDALRDDDDEDEGEDEDDGHTEDHDN